MSALQSSGTQIAGPCRLAWRGPQVSKTVKPRFATSELDPHLGAIDLPLIGELGNQLQRVHKRDPVRTKFSAGIHRSDLCDTRDFRSGCNTNARRFLESIRVGPLKTNSYTLCTVDRTLESESVLLSSGQKGRFVDAGS